MYEKNRGRSKISSANGDKGRIDAKKSDAVCVCGGKRNVHYELLLPSQTINFNLYCQQLQKLRQAIERKQPELINGKGIVHHDNARPHTSLAICQKLR